MDIHMTERAGMNVVIDDNQPINVTMSGDSNAFSPGFSGGVIQGSGNIDDDHILPTSTWSSQKINEELGKKLNSTAMADAYAQGGRYAVGDYCTYNGDVLVCTANISSAAATPDMAKWSVVDGIIETIPVPASAASVQAIIDNYLT